jgi:hypothetical protein
VLYYTVYNPIYWRRDQHEPLEVYRLVNGGYQRQIPGSQGELGGVIWMPEVGLGIGRGMGSFCGLEREWLFWYDQNGNRFLTPEEVAQRERDLARQAIEMAQQAQEMAQQAQETAQQEREMARQAQEIAQQEREMAQKLAAKLRELGIDPEV